MHETRGDSLRRGIHAASPKTCSIRTPRSASPLETGRDGRDSCRTAHNPATTASHPARRVPNARRSGPLGDNSSGQGMFEDDQ